LQAISLRAKRNTCCSEYVRFLIWQPIATNATGAGLNFACGNHANEGQAKQFSANMDKDSERGAHLEPLRAFPIQLNRNALKSRGSRLMHVGASDMRGQAQGKAFAGIYPTA
jgi:hypothetical protein